MEKEISLEVSEKLVHGNTFVELGDRNHRFSVACIDILNCLKAAEMFGAVPTISEEWWNAEAPKRTTPFTGSGVPTLAAAAVPTGEVFELPSEECVCDEKLYFEFQDNTGKLQIGLSSIVAVVLFMMRKRIIPEDQNVLDKLWNFGNVCAAALIAPISYFGTCPETY